MKCEVAQQYIVLYAYGELEDEISHELEQHLAGCEHCKHEVQVVQTLQQVMSLRQAIEPSPNLLTQSRMRLEETLDTMPAHSAVSRLRGLFWGWAAHLRTAPVLAALLVMAGFGGGHLLDHYTTAPTPTPHQSIVLTNAANGTIADVSGIVQTPNSDLVQVNYNRLVPESIQGSLDDPQIRQLLLLATQNHIDNGVRADSVKLLADECRAGHECDDGSIRNALMVALRYDKSSNVRLKALDGLQPYIAQDTRVRDAVLEALIHDPDANVRTEAINLIEPVQADSSVRDVLHTVSTQDVNPYIRTASRQVLEQVSDIQ
ncbi:MAG: HEAT repeat domain-containing protein [Acidobacteriaceae bacterium]